MAHFPELCYLEGTKWEMFHLLSHCNNCDKWASWIHLLEHIDVVSQKTWIYWATESFSNWKYIGILYPQLTWTWPGLPIYDLQGSYQPFPGWKESQPWTALEMLQELEGTND